MEGAGVALPPGSNLTFNGNRILAHEIGHIRGRPHAPCGGACGTDLFWPDDTSPEAALDEVGFDVAKQKVLLSDVTLDPNMPGNFYLYADFMSYCMPAWITTYTYL